MVTQLVTPEDLANTYDPETGWTTVQQYREATQLRADNPEMARAEIARRVGRPPSAIRGWIAENKTPRPAHGIATARDQGWLDIESTSEIFRALNQLVAWIFSGGGLQQDRYVPIFSVDDQIALATIHQLLTWVDVPYRLRDDDEHAYEVIPSTTGAVLGRVLYTLGAPRGTKRTQDDLTLPSYLDQVEPAHRRDFARIYLLNRGQQPTDGSAGTYVQGFPAAGFTPALRDVFDPVTNGTVSVSSQDRLWVSADVVHDLAGATPPYPSLGTQAAFGTVMPPTERAFASTYRRQKRPSGYRYAQLYEHVQASAAPPATVAEQHAGLTAEMVRSWRRGHTPRVYQALAAARSHGWLSASPESETAQTLTALLAWIFANGTLRSTSYYPVFRMSNPDQRAIFNGHAETLGISYSLARVTDPDRTTEAHPGDDGSVLGRVLYTLGAPLGAKSETPCLPPVYLYRDRTHAMQFIRGLCRHLATADDELEIRIGTPLGTQFGTGLAELITTHCDCEPIVTDKTVTIQSPPDAWVD